MFCNAMVYQVSAEFLKTYDLYDLYMAPVNEAYDSTEDMKVVKQLAANIKVEVIELIKKLAKVGALETVKLLTKAAALAYKKGKDNIEVLRTLMYALLFLLAGFTTNAIKDANNKRIEPNVSYKYEGGKLYIENSETDTIYVIEEGPKGLPTMNIQLADEKAEVKQNQELDRLPLRVKRSDEAIPVYEASDAIADALMEVEHFSATIYDAKKPGRKNIDMSDMSQDLTIGYGHKLTSAERKAWKSDKKISKKEATELFRKDLKATEKLVNAHLKQLPYGKDVIFSQGFYDAICSLTFNMGAGNMWGNATRKPCTLWQRLEKCRVNVKDGTVNKADIDFAIAKILTQNVILPGHKIRRKAEYSICSQPVGGINKAIYKLKG